MVGELTLAERITKLRLSASRAGSGPVHNPYYFRTVLLYLVPLTYHPSCLQFAQNTLIARIHHHQTKVTERGGTKQSKKTERPLAYRKLSPRSDKRGGSSPRCEQSSDVCGIFHALTTLQGDLGADVRVEAERKLKALEADLAAGERANKERALATRYHKVKFFGALCCVVLHIISLTKIIRSSEAPA